MFNFDTADLEAAIAYVTASAIDMRRGTAFGALVWRNAHCLLEFRGGAANAQVVEIALNRAGWVGERVIYPGCAWFMCAGELAGEDSEQLELFAA